MVKLVLLATLAGLLAVQAVEVQELASINPSPQDVADGHLAGIAEGTRELNMPGPMYGKPGYKESHNWETDVDIFSPTVFNQDFYAAKQGLADKNTAEIKTAWKDALAADTLAPDCQQAVAGFSLNLYDQNNPSVHDSTGGKCNKLLENYLQTGVFDGLSGATNTPILRQSQSTFTVQKTELDTDLVGKESLTPSREYTLTFWVKLLDSMAVESNILHIGDTEYARSPSVYVKAGTTNLKFSISQSNEQDFHCSLDGTEEPGALEKKKWYNIALVVGSNKGTVFVDGVKKTECENAEGTTVKPPAGTHVYVSDPWSEPARAELQKVAYYSDYQMSEGEVAAQSKIEQAVLVTA